MCFRALNDEKYLEKCIGRRGGGVKSKEFNRKEEGITFDVNVAMLH